MSSHRAASRYAKSILGLAKEQKVMDELYSDMQLFSKVVAENRIFAIMLKNPIINHDKKKSVLHALFESKMNKLTLLAFDLITKKNRENILAEIALEYQVQYNVLKGLQDAEIKTTIALDKDLQKKFKDLVEDITGKKASLNEIIDDDIVGGFILNIGDKRIDQSIKTQLQNIKRELTN
ncbi:MAG: ATP synthase F1 subunit delta [Bacteroidota bacterium]